MGDCQNEDLRVGFDRTLKLKFLGSTVTTDAERLYVDPAMRHVVGGRLAGEDKLKRSYNGYS